MSERQVDLGLGRGLKPGALSVPKDGEDEHAKEAPSKLLRKFFLDEKRTRRRTTVGVVDLKRTIVQSNITASHDSQSRSMEISLQFQLQSALQEAEVLRQELDSYRKQLDSKHSAIRILRQQMTTTAVKLDDLHTQSSHMRRDMTTEINRLQFELEYNQNILMESQQTWSQRFDRVCQENVKQQSALNSRDDEIRQLTEERRALARDREELLALLDPVRRAQWCASESSIAFRAASSAAINGSCSCGSTSASVSTTGATTCVENSAALPFDTDNKGCGSIELAVLGACRCRGDSPCRCAYAAARLKREVARARELAVEARQRAEDAYVVVDAYRNAFEEQLSRNRNLTMRMGELATNSGPSNSRGSRLKALLTWVGRQLQDLGLTNDGDGNSQRTHPHRKRQVSSGRSWRNFAMRRASTVDDLGLASACQGGNNLSSSSWSISESLVSSGVLGAADMCIDEDADGDDEAHADGEADIDDCRHDAGDSEKSYHISASRSDEFNEEELMTMLLEKLCERTESAAHQRITAQVLKRPGASSRDTGACRTDVSASSGVFSATSSEMPSTSSQ